MDIHSAVDAEVTTRLALAQVLSDSCFLGPSSTHSHHDTQRSRPIELHSLHVNYSGCIHSPRVIGFPALIASTIYSAISKWGIRTARLFLSPGELAASSSHWLSPGSMDMITNTELHRPWEIRQRIWHVLVWEVHDVFAAEMDAPRLWDKMPFMSYAVMTGKVRCVLEALSSGSRDVDQMWTTGQQDHSSWSVFALHLATLLGYTEIVRVLLDMGLADVNQVGSDGFTALIYAVGNSAIDCASVILAQENCSVDLRLSWREETALHLVARMGNSKLVELLLEGSPEINMCDDFGHSALMEAVSSSAIECVQLILRRKECNVKYSIKARRHSAASGD